MKKLTVGFSRAKGFKPGSWLIRLGTGKPYSHVYFQWYSERYQEYLTYEASHGMVHFTGFKQFQNERDVIKVYELNVPLESYENFVKKCIQLCGVKYGSLQLIGIAFIKILKAFGISSKYTNYLGFGRSQYVCSELAADLLQDCFNIPCEIDLDQIEPSDIDSILEKYCNT